MASLAAFLLLGSPAARAGSYVGIYTDPVSQAPSPYSGGTHYTATGQDAYGQPTFSDVPDSLSTNSSSQQGYGGGSSPTLPHGTHADCRGAIQTSWKWVPAPGQTMTTDPPPSSVIIMQTCTVSVTVEQPGGTGSYDDGLGQSGSVSFSPPDHLTGSATDTKYTVVTGATLTLPAISPQASVTNSPANASVSYTASIVNGGWNGPYYFHKGQYAQGVQSNPTTSSWWNNMAGDYPTGTDTYDSNNVFQLQETTAPFAESTGTIIPVWVWSGPNLPGGAAPPAFNINETTDAFAEDETNGGGTDWDVDDGQGNTYVTNTQNEDYVLDTKPNTTTVSSFTTASGSVWWALGQPFKLTASANGFGVYPPYNYYVFVGMSANLASQ